MEVEFIMIGKHRIASDLVPLRGRCEHVHHLFLSDYYFVGQTWSIGPQLKYLDQ